MGLQKLIYFCHAWHLVKTEQPLIKQNFEAWEHGPVLQFLYREFKECGSSPIKKRATKMDKYTGLRELASDEIGEETQEIIESVLAFYGRLSAAKLREISHAEGGPWDEVWNHSNVINPGMKIDNRNILRYYSRLPQNVSAQ